MQMKLPHLLDNCKLVSVAVDVMAIKEGLSYNSKPDVVGGFSDNVSRSEELANHAIVFMARGVVHKWKQLVGYVLSNGQLNGSLTTQLLKQCIDKLHAIGLTVVIVICDQGSNNQNMFTSQLGMTTKRPFFVYKGHIIYAMYGPPHLIKNVRNNLKKHGLMVDGRPFSGNTPSHSTP